MTDKNNQLLTVSEALDFLGISRATFDRWKKEKQLPYIKIGKEVFVNKEKLEQWMLRFDSSEARSATVMTPSLPIHIGYQSGSAQLWSSIIIKRLGLLEEELKLLLPKQACHIHWHHANNGIELVQQFVADKLNFIAAGDYPIHISFQLGRLFPSFNPLLLAFDGKTISNSGIALVLQKQLTSSRTLTIAAVPSTSSSYHLQQLMNTLSCEVNIIAKSSMEACMDSMLQQEVDGAMLWEPYLSQLEELKVGTRMPMEESTVYLTGILASQNWLNTEHNTLIAHAYLKALLRAHQLLHKQDVKALQAIEAETSFSQTLIQQVISHIRYDAIVYHEDIKCINNIYSDATLSPLFLDAKTDKSTHTKINYDSTYLKEAIKALQLPALNKQYLSGKWTNTLY